MIYLKVPIFPGTLKKCYLCFFCRKIYSGQSKGIPLRLNNCKELLVERILNIIEIFKLTQKSFKIKKFIKFLENEKIIDFIVNFYKREAEEDPFLDENGKNGYSIYIELLFNYDFGIEEKPKLSL